MLVLLSRIARAVALLLIVLAIADPPLGRARAPDPLVALDVSGSWLRGGDTSAWRQAARRYTELSGDDGMLAGDSVTAGAPPRAPAARSADFQRVLNRAAAEGRGAVLITDGEIARLDTTRASAGSRIEVIRPKRRPDLAIARMEGPASTPEADTMSIFLRLAADEAGAGAGRVDVEIDGRPWGTAAIQATRRFGTAEATVRGTMPAGRGAARVTSIARTQGDAEPRNDTARMGIARAPVVSAVFISTAPDFDARFAAAALRETVSLPVRAFNQVAPGSWRTAGGQPVTRDAVLFAAIRAPLVALHGDTAHFGPPRRVFSASLALVPAVRERGEWLADTAPPSPLASLLGEVQWDSLAPLSADAGPPGGSWVGLRAKRLRTDARAVVTGYDGARRVVVVTGAGFYAWKLRGGVAADAHAALWGGIFDWLVARTSGMPAAPSFERFSPELLPAAPSVESSSFGSVPVYGEPRRARDWPVLYILIVGLLCGEWILRRRAGLR